MFLEPFLKTLLFASLLIWSTLGSAQAQNTNSPASAPSNTPQNSTSPTALPVAAPDTNLSQVHDRLKLTDSQQPLWLAYVKRIDDYNKVYYFEKPVSALSGDAAPRQIGRLFDNMQNRLAAFDEVEQTAKALYAALDPGQKQTADQLLLSTIPVFASSTNFSCPPPSESKPKNERDEGNQRKRRGGGMGAMGQ
jgi:hypothetical protein